MLSAWFRVARDRRGAIAVIVAAMSIPLIIALGMAVDYARLMTVRAELQRSVDSAAIAGARIMVTTPPNDGAMQTDVNMYFWANYRHSTDGFGNKIGFLDSTVPNPTMSVNQQRTIVRVDAQAQVKLLFGGFFGYNSTTLNVTAQAEKFVPGLELVLALDTSNSMKAAGRLAALKTGATSLMDIVFGNVDSVYNDACAYGPATPSCREWKILVGLVPFGATVNIRPTTRDWGGALFGTVAANPTDAGGMGANIWKGCVEAIRGSGDMPGYDAFGAVDPVLSQEYANNTATYPPTWDPDGSSGPAPPALVAIQPYRWKPNPSSRYFRTTASPTIGTFLTPNYWVPVAQPGPPPVPATQERFYLTQYPAGLFDVLWHWRRGTGSGFTFTDGSADTGVNGPTGPRESGPNRGCGFPVLPLQTSKVLAKSAINELQFGAPNGTTIGLGFTWAWRLLAPQWAPVWQAGDFVNTYGSYWNTPLQSGAQFTKTQSLTPINRPSDPAQLPNISKVVVLFTDAAGNEMGVCPAAPIFNPGPPQWEAQTGDCWYYNAYGDWLNNPLGSSPETQLDAQTVRVCTAMKAAGIQIYTIVLDSTVNPAVEALMRGPAGCSSDTSTVGTPAFYIRAPDNQALIDAFKYIGASIANLRLIN
jgi:Flp pilus assembly protein TadG